MRSKIKFAIMFSFIFVLGLMVNYKVSYAGVCYTGVEKCLGAAAKCKALCSNPAAYMDTLEPIPAPGGWCTLTCAF